MRYAALLTLAVLLLAGCAPSPAATPPAAGRPSGPTPPAVSETGGFNGTDVMFAQMMLAQYEPTAALLGIARTRTSTEKIRTLAAAIAVTQADESAMVGDWLESWHEPLVPDADAGAHAGHGGLPGDAQAQVTALREASDRDFDKVFLNLLLGRQHQAVEYARMELGSGAHAGALALATRIDQSRTAQITMMLALVA